MLRLRYVGSETDFLVAFSKLSDHIVEVKGDLPVNTSGFHMSRLDIDDKWDYTRFTTVYQEIDGGIRYSDDGSVYVEPVPPIPEIKFVANGGGTLEGETDLEAEKWEDVIIPTPVPEEGYVFVGWNPEIPTEGDVESGTYTALFKDYHVNFVAGENGYLEGDTYQLVDDYAELNIPVPVAHENFKFSGWVPEVPESGTIDLDNLIFTAVFQSNLPDRVKSLEGDMEALNRVAGGE